MDEIEHGGLATSGEFAQYMSDRLTPLSNLNWIDKDTTESVKDEYITLMTANLNQAIMVLEPLSATPPEYLKEKTEEIDAFLREARSLRERIALGRDLREEMTADMFDAYAKLVKGLHTKKVEETV